MDELMVAQLGKFRELLQQMVKIDQELDELFENGEFEELFPTGRRKTADNPLSKEFEKLKIEYLEFEAFFQKYDGNYWGGELSVLDVVDKIKEEVLA